MRCERISGLEIAGHKRRYARWWYWCLVIAVLFAIVLILATPPMADAAQRIEYREVWVNATANAPLDPLAKAGVCHNGNPRKVAYGDTNPELDISASWDFPKKTWVFIDAVFDGKVIGWRQVNDRFGSFEAVGHIKNRIDISMWRLADARRWGNRKIRVLVGR